MPGTKNQGFDAGFEVIETIVIVALIFWGVGLGAAKLLGHLAQYLS